MTKLGGRLTSQQRLQRFFNRSWTLDEAKEYLAGSKSLRPENVQLLKLIELHGAEAK